MTLTVVRNDITKMNVDAIVNAANTDLQMGGGVCGAIFRAAGSGRLQRACDELAPIATGAAVMTSGFDLPVKYIIHTAGPVYQFWSKEKASSLLYNSYVNSLDLALSHGCNTVAFPLISAGIYGYPKDQAMKIANQAIGDWLQAHEMEVFLVVFDKEAFSVSQGLLGEIRTYIDEHYINARYDYRRESLRTEEFGRPGADADKQIPAFENKLSESFAFSLLKLIDQKGKTDVDVYKKANIDRKLFSKIRNSDYHPRKNTALALAVALELTMQETQELIGRAGYALSRSSLFDVIIEYFINQGKYDIFEINNLLFEYEQPQLGG